MSRTAFRGRECVVYLPSAEDLKVWKDEAEKNGTSLSKYIFEMAQRGRRATGGIAYRSDDAGDDRSKLIAKIALLEEKLHDQSLLAEKMQQNLEDLKTQTDSTYYFMPALINLFKNDKVISKDDLISWLHLKPNDSEKMRDLFRLLNLLTEWQLINSTARGDWKWIK
jgi:hypothetical protein